MNAADYIQEAFSAVAVAARRYNNPPGLTAMVHGTLRILAIVRLLFRRVFIARHGACTRVLYDRVSPRERGITSGPCGFLAKLVFPWAHVQVRFTCRAVHSTLYVTKRASFKYFSYKCVGFLFGNEIVIKYKIIIR